MMTILASVFYLRSSHESDADDANARCVSWLKICSVSSCAANPNYKTYKLIQLQVDDLAVRVIRSSRFDER